ncbi:hypothetical protein THASP1DRAFT_17075, partial [Thamnocephalis sphaerospora]
MHRLGVLLGTFLHQQPFASTSSWQNCVAKPFFDNLAGSERRVSQMLHSVMIRNQRKDIERDVQLPALYECTITLDFTHLQRLTYNCLVALQHLNAVLTQRVDRDYFFHPSNRKPLMESVNNLWQSCFWYTPSSMHQMYEALKHAEEGVERAEKR